MSDIVEQLREGCLRVGEDDSGEEVYAVDDATDVMCEAADEITRLRKELDRCHARLEIDHHFVMGDGDDLVRVEVPYEERCREIDGIEARDATIALIENDNDDLRDELALAEARGMERAAVIAETRHAYWQMPHPDDARAGEVCDDISACKDIAAAIRAEKPGTALQERSDG